MKIPARRLNRDETETNIFSTDQKLVALETAAKMLASLPEKKALVYFSAGVGKSGVDNQAQLRSTVAAAVRSNVSFYPIDISGLVALPPGGDATHAEFARHRNVQRRLRRLARSSRSTISRRRW